MAPGDISDTDSEAGSESMLSQSHTEKANNTQAHNNGRASGQGLQETFVYEEEEDEEDDAPSSDIIQPTQVNLLSLVKEGELLSMVTIFLHLNWHLDVCLPNMIASNFYFMRFPPTQNKCCLQII